MKPAKILGELKAELRKVHSCGSDTDWFIAMAIMFLIEHCSLKPKTKRKASDWSVFLGGYLRNGKSIQEAAKDWKKRN